VSPALLTIDEAAAYLAMTRRTLSRLRRSDVQLAAAFVLVGKNARARRVDLDRWVSALPAGWSTRGGRRERKVA
jgi:excisionase family DNA binding protein